MELTRKFWGSQGRIGIAHSGPWSGRLIFVYPDSAPEWWTVVVDPPPVEAVPGDMYFNGNDVILRLNSEWTIDWIVSGLEEERLERARFGWRPLSGDAQWLPS